MKGKVLDFTAGDGRGVIAAEDGNRYSFSAADWKARDRLPAPGVQVDLVASAPDAREIYIDAPAEDAPEGSDLEARRAQQVRVTGGDPFVHKTYPTAQ